jgi:hypothetical protein
MGLEFGFEIKEETEQTLVLREAEKSEMEEAFLAPAVDWSSMAASFDAAEEAAVSMGLTLGMTGNDYEDMLEDMAEEFLYSHVFDEAVSKADRCMHPEEVQKDWCTELETHLEEEEAATSMGLPLDLDGPDLVESKVEAASSPSVEGRDDSNEPKRVAKKARLGDGPPPSPSTPPRRILSVQLSEEKRHHQLIARDNGQLAKECKKISNASGHGYLAKVLECKQATWMSSRWMSSPLPEGSLVGPLVRVFRFDNP